MARDVVAVGPAQGEAGVAELETLGQGRRIRPVEWQRRERGPGIRLELAPHALARVAGGLARVQGGDLLAQIGQGGGEHAGIGGSLVQLRSELLRRARVVGQAVARQEARRRLSTDEVGDALVERCVARDVGGRVDQLVEQRLDELEIVGAQHRLGDGVGEPAERRVGSDWDDADVEALGAQGVGFSLGGLLVEEAFVRDRPDEREAEARGFDFARPRGDDRRHDPIPRPGDVARILLPDVEPDRPGVAADLFDQAELVAQGRWRRRVGQQLVDRLAVPQHAGLACSQMPVVATGARRQHECGEERDEARSERDGTGARSCARCHGCGDRLGRSLGARRAGRRRRG